MRDFPAGTLVVFFHTPGRREQYPRVVPLENCDPRRDFFDGRFRILRPGESGVFLRTFYYGPNGNPWEHGQVTITNSGGQAVWGEVVRERSEEIEYVFDLAGRVTAVLIPLPQPTALD